MGDKQRALWYFPKRPIALGHYIASNSFYVSHVLSKLFACTKDRHTLADQNNTLFNTFSFFLSDFDTTKMLPLPIAFHAKA